MNDSYTLKTRIEAVNILDGMEEIIRNEMLVAGHYASSWVQSTELAEFGALCHGHSACAVGSMWLAGGVELVDTSGGRGVFELPGVAPGHRWEVLDGNPALLCAYDEMNGACQEYVDDNDIELSDSTGAYEGGMENMLERWPGVHNEEDDGAIQDGALEEVRGVFLDLLDKVRAELGAPDEERVAPAPRTLIETEAPDARKGAVLHYGRIDCDYREIGKRTLRCANLDPMGKAYKKPAFEVLLSSNWTTVGTAVVA